MKKIYLIVLCTFYPSLVFNYKNQNAASHDSFIQLKDNTIWSNLAFDPLHLQLQCCFEN